MLILDWNDSLLLMLLSLLVDFWCICIKAFFNWVSKTIRECFGFALLRSVIGPKNLQVVTGLHAFSRALGGLVVFTLVLIGSYRYFLSSDWPLWLLWFCFDDTQSKSASRVKVGIFIITDNWKMSRWLLISNYVNIYYHTV